MATKKRLIELIECLEHCANDSPCNQCLRWNHKCDRHCVNDLLDTAAKELKKFVDAVPVDEIKLHHVIIDNEGVPEAKLQIGDRYFLLRTDPVDVREVVHGRWNFDEECWAYNCSNCRRTTGVSRIFPYCPNCGAKMDGERKDND